MAGKSATINVNIVGDASGFSGALRQAETKLAAFSGRMEAIGTKMRSVGEKMTMGLSLPILGALGLGVKWAGELEDAQAMSAQVFGSMSSQMDAWAANAAKNFGLSKGEATEWASQMGIRLRQIGGLSETEAARVSQNLVQLGGDFASAFGGSVDEASQAIASALTGEFEPLKRYGVVINDVGLKQKYLALTGEEVKGTLTGQQKQVATLALIEEQASIVKGDYARNADGATNAQRTMTAQLKDAATTLGTTLLPYVTKAVQFISELTEKFQQLSPGMQKVILIGGLIAAAIGPLVFIFGSLATAIGFIASPIGLVVAAIAGLVAGFVYLYNTNEGFREWVNEVASVIWDKLQAAFAWIKDTAIPAVVDGFNWLKENVIPVVVDVAGKVVDGFQKMAGWVRTAWDWIYEKVSTFIGWFQANVAPVISSVIDLVVAVFQRVWQVVQAVWPPIQAVISTVVDVIAAVIRGFIAIVEPIWNALWGGFKAVVSVVWDTIKGAIEVALDVIRGIIDTVTGVITGNWDKVWNGILTVVRSIWDGIKGAVEGAINTVRSIIGSIVDWVSDKFGGVWGKIADTARGAIDSVVGFIRELPGRIGDFVSTVAGKAADIGRALLNGIGEGISGAVGWIGDLGSKVWESVKGGINRGLDTIRNFKVPDWVPLAGGMKPFGSFPRLARGGLADYAGLYSVGERGPETVMLPRGARVIPNHMGGGGAPQTITVYAETNADPFMIGREVAWAMRTSGR